MICLCFSCNRVFGDKVTVIVCVIDVVNECTKMFVILVLYCVYRFCKDLNVYLLWNNECLFFVSLLWKTLSFFVVMTVWNLFFVCLVFVWFYDNMIPLKCIIFNGRICFFNVFVTIVECCLCLKRTTWYVGFQNFYWLFFDCLLWYLKVIVTFLPLCAFGKIINFKWWLTWLIDWLMNFLKNTLFSSTL